MTTERELAIAAKRAAAEELDMAKVGRALMQAIAMNRDSLRGWAPNNCPSEIVADLINERDEALAAPPDAAQQALDALTEGVYSAARLAIVKLRDADAVCKLPRQFGERPFMVAATRLERAIDAHIAHPATPQEQK